MTTTSITRRGGLRLSWRSCALGLAGMLALLLAACGGTEGAVPGNPTGTPAGATETATPTPTPTAPIATSYGALESYRYEVTMTIATEAFGEGGLGPGMEDLTLELQVRGTRVNPDREHTETVANLGLASVEVESITIGDEQWMRQAGGEWRRTSASLPAGIPLDIDIRPSRIFGSDDWDEDEIARLEAVFERYPHEIEIVNGMSSRHYRFTAQQFAQLFAGSDPTEGMRDIEVVFEVWVAEDYGVPVAMVITGTTPQGAQALRFALEIYDLNASSLEVEPPDED